MRLEVLEPAGPILESGGQIASSGVVGKIGFHGVVHELLLEKVDFGKDQEESRLREPLGCEE